MSKWMDIVYEKLEEFNSFAVKKRPELLTIQDLDAKFVLPGENEKKELLEARLQAAFLSIVKSNLDADPSANQKFIDKTSWDWLDKLLALARIKELTGVRIVKKGGRSSGLRFDITELSNSYYGRKILKSINFNPSRKIVNKQELEAIRQECDKIKLKLPEEIQPTTTEIFFDENNED